MRSFILVCIILLGSYLTAALPFHFQLSPYAPVQTQCPPGPLVRPAQGLSAGESQYIQQRRQTTSDNLRAFYLRLNVNRLANDSFPALSMPTPNMAFASSGGGVRALLAGAGVIQAMDKRDHAADDSPLSGLWQCFNYHSGLSGGSWLVSSMAGNDKVTISSLATDLWISGFSDPSFLPWGKQEPDTYARIVLAIVAKFWAGLPTSLVDTWGRVVSQHTLLGKDGGVSTTLSGIMNNSDFQTYQAPYPIITALAIEPASDLNGCSYANLLSPQFEFTPHEFGSWDGSIRSFALTSYLGTQIYNGEALSKTGCVAGYDNLGWIQGCSSNLFNYFCEVPPSNLLTGNLGSVQSQIIQMTSLVHDLTFEDEYGLAPNPFANWTDMSGETLSVSDTAYFVDGGEANENLPMWPLIQPERNIDVILANDNSADTTDTNWPNASSLHYTSMRAEYAGLTTLPDLPPPELLVARNPNQMPLVFGCFQLDKITIIWLPNKEYSFDSGIHTWLLLYSSEKVVGMIENGNQVATLGQDPSWPTCLGCFMMMRSNQGNGLPSDCYSCMDRFCWKG